MFWILFAFFFALSFTVTPTPADAGHCEIPPSARLGRPDADGPTKVQMGLLLIDVFGISDEDQTVDLDALTRVSWRDPRLRDFVGCRVPLEEIWTPQLELLNSSSLRNRSAPTAFIDEGGEVSISRRFTGHVISPHTLEDFPFDARNILLQIAPRSSSIDEVVLEIDRDASGKRANFSIADWTIGDPNLETSVWVLSGLAQSRSRLDFEIPAKRLRGYWIFKVMVPLTMIIAMSWAVFWIDTAHFATAIGLAATSMLTLIAFQFSVAATLPRVSYLTIMDSFVFGAAVLVFLALIEAVVTSALVGSGRGELARRLDYYGRFILPTALLGLILSIFFQVRAAGA